MDAGRHGRAARRRRQHPRSCGLVGRVARLADGSTLVVAENSRIVVAHSSSIGRTRRARCSSPGGGQGEGGGVPGRRHARASAPVELHDLDADGGGRGARHDVRGRVRRAEHDARRGDREGSPAGDRRGLACLSIQDGSSVLVREGLASYAMMGTSGCSPPIPISLLPDASLVGTLQNPIVPGPPSVTPSSSLPSPTSEAPHL